MARDRQRSKARQRARAAGKKPGGKSARSRARDVGLDDPEIDESGLTDNAPAPDPLKNASADVDQAKAAETGVARGPAGDEIDLSEEDDDDFDRAGDEVEIPRDLVSGGGRGGAGGGGRGGAGGGEELEHEQPHDPDRRQHGRVLSFLGACVDELRRVQWPDRKHVIQATAVVLGFCLLAGGYLGLMDAIWQPLINAIL